MYDSLSGLLGVATVYGAVQLEKLITPANAKPGDLILCTKPLGLETITKFFNNPQGLGEELVRGISNKKNFQGRFTCKAVFVRRCTWQKLDVVHAMHDATEGGFVVGVKRIG